MANGNIKVSTDVIAKFSELYSVSLDYKLTAGKAHVHWLWDGRRLCIVL